jgi:hypothetical protein
MFAKFPLVSSIFAASKNIPAWFSKPKLKKTAPLGLP